MSGKKPAQVLRGCWDIQDLHVLRCLDSVQLFDQRILDMFLNTWPQVYHLLPWPGCMVRGDQTLWSNNSCGGGGKLLRGS